MSKKDLPAFGDNSKPLCQEHMLAYHELHLQEIKIRGKKKDVLGKVKKDGWTKKGFKDAHKEILESEAQKQYRQSVEEDKQYCFDLCEEMDLKAA